MKTLISIFILSVWAVSTLAFAAPSFNLPAQAIEVAKGVYDLGTAVDNGRTVRGYAFVRYRKDFQKPVNSGNENGGNDEGGGTTLTCFAFISKGVKWKTAEDHILNSSTAGMTDRFVVAQIATATGIWNNEISLSNDGTIFGSRISGSVDGADTVSTDGKNEILFADIAEPNVIAVTITRGIFGGPPFARESVEWDRVGAAAFDPIAFELQDQLKLGKYIRGRGPSLCGHRVV